MKTSRGPGRVSLPRALSKLGFASRSQAVGLVVSGAVKVDGKVERNPHCWIDLGHQRIEVHDQIIDRQSFRFVMLNKPKGYVTTRSDERGRSTAFDLLGEQARGLITVGRLDKESTGLLLFTSDHRFADQLTSPESGVLKTYVVEVDRSLGQEDLRLLAKGMELIIEGKSVRTKPAGVRLLQERKLEIALSEGKNKQIRRMLEELGYKVESLRRIAIGSLYLGELAEGHSRDLSAPEVSALRGALTTRIPEPASPRRGGKQPGRSFRGKRRFKDR